MPNNTDRGENSRESQNADYDPTMPQAASPADDELPIDSSQNSGSPGGDVQDAGLADEASTGIGGTDAAQGDTLPPPSAHRPDTMVRAVSPDARQQMERGGNFGNQASFTKGVNAPPIDQSRYPYTVEDMDEILSEAPRGLFPDTPGGDGATPLSADRNTFLRMMGDRGHFPSQQETEKWAHAVFNALRQCAIEQDDALATEFKDVVRFGEAPEVQVEEMMWGGDFVSRFARMAALLQNWSKQEFYEQLAEEAHETPDDPWVDAAVHSFFGALKRAMGPDAERGIGNLGELQEVWDRA